MFAALLKSSILVALGVAAVTPADAARTLNVSSRAGLIDAIARAQNGDRIILAPGNYGAIDIRGKSWSTDVMLMAASTANPARIDALTVNAVSHLSIKSLHIGRPLNPGEPNYGIFGNFRSVSSVTLDDVFVHGSMDNNPVNDGNGLNFVDSRNVTIKACRFEQLGRGLSASGSTDIVFNNNVFRAMRTDGMNFANVQRVTIDGNKFSDFFVGVGDHPDAIQFWTAGTKQASSNIIIRNNQIFQGRGAGTQGIFLTDQIGTLPYQNVRIENNLLYVYDGYNGIMVGNGRGIEIIGNSVLSESRDNQKYWIRLDRVEGVTLRNNVADSFVNQNNKSMTMDNNVFLDARPSVAGRIRDLQALAEATAAGLVIPGVGYQPPVR
ncbi:MAG: right-handed parallel beta-helix repeat-containing protein [Pseudomonadota bacterium]